jgi:hypothetical protein
MAFYDLGVTHGRQAHAEDLAREWLHRDARMWTEMAVSTAAARHGVHWSAAIREQAEAEAVGE